jgi:hypothetical protein
MRPEHAWLKHVRISDFRGYGRDFELPLAPRGSVILLSGPNGLGKTSFFEAIEWALTGQIERLERLSDSSKLELIRKAPGVQECEVALTFKLPEGGNDNIVERKSTRSRGQRTVVTGTPLDAVVDLLRNRSWTVPPSSLSRYLLLTHIHPQSAPLRLVARKAGERWGWVSQLAGTEKLERVRQQVPGLKNSLTRLAGDREEVLGTRQQERRDWLGWLEQHEKLRNQLTTLGGAIAPNEILRRLRRAVRSAKVSVP